MGLFEQLRGVVKWIAGRWWKHTSSGVGQPRRITWGDELKQRNGLGCFARDSRLIAHGYHQAKQAATLL
jgi:hypothetical protein